MAEQSITQIRHDAVKRAAAETTPKRLSGSQALDLTTYPQGSFGRWTPLRRGPDIISKAGFRRTTWHCRCECGTLWRVRTQSLLNGQSGSCGCLKREIAIRTITKVNAERKNLPKSARTAARNETTTSPD